MFVISFKSNYYGLSYPFTMKLNRFFRYCLKELVWYRAEKDAKTNMRFGFNAPTLDQQYWFEFATANKRKLAELQQNNVLILDHRWKPGKFKSC